ncbi:MAG: DUF885 domain-containing protein [Myxococcota bacterium]|nr:DUF885 domain-containing protein [Myxococcota bacterium]
MTEKKCLCMALLCIAICMLCGCDEDEPKKYDDLGVCEPRLTDIQATIDSLAGLPFDALLESAEQAIIQRSPELVTELALSETLGMRDDALDDISEAYQRQTIELVKGIQAIFKSINPEMLTSDQRISLETFEWFLDDWIREEPFIRHFYPLTQMSGAHLNLFGLFYTIHPVQTRQHIEDFIARLTKVDDKLACLRENLRLRAEQGTLPPFFMLEGAMEDLAGIKPGVARHLSMYGALKAKLSTTTCICEADKQHYLKQAESAIEANVIPAYMSLIDLLAELAEIAPDGGGVGRMPNGAAFYAHLLRHHTTTEMTADEIHALGKSDMDRIRADMDTLFAELQYPVNETLFDHYNRAMADGGIIDADQVIPTYEALVDEALLRVDQAFNEIPVSELVVVGGSSGGWYVPGAPDGSRPGEFHVKSDTPIPWYGMMTLTHHEAIPGHHFQISIAQEAALPSFRVNGFTAYVEGWALYAERLAKELGWFDSDIYADLGRLHDEMLRAVRLVVDTGIHAKGWPLMEAVQYMKDFGGFDHAFAVNQIGRYAALPGQAVAYKIGMLRILALREKAKEALGDNFDLKAFHSAVLLGGSVPLDILETVVQNYIDNVAMQKDGSKAATIGLGLPRRILPLDRSKPIIWTPDH